MLTVFFKDTGTHPYLRRGFGRQAMLHSSGFSSIPILSDSHPAPLPTGIPSALSAPLAGGLSERGASNQMYFP